MVSVPIFPARPRHAPRPAEEKPTGREGRGNKWLASLFSREGRGNKWLASLFSKCRDPPQTEGFFSNKLPRSLSSRATLWPATCYRAQCRPGPPGFFRPSDENRRSRGFPRLVTKPASPAKSRFRRLPPRIDPEATSCLHNYIM